MELLDACIERIESLNPKINAFAATCFERARDEALLAEQAVMQGKPLGLLHGLPIGIKDPEETAGVLTTYGSQLFRDNIPAQDNRSSRACVQPGQSWSARPMFRSWAQAPIPAMWCGARPVTRSILN